MSDTNKPSKQDIVVSMVKEGIHTRDEIRAAAACTTGALASYLTALRNAAKYSGEPICPVEVEKEIDGKAVKVFSVVSYEEAESMRAEKATSSKTSTPKDPNARYLAAKKRVDRCEKAAKSAADRAEKGKTEELDLRAEKARIELRLAEIEMETITKFFESEGLEFPKEPTSPEMLEETEPEEMPEDEEVSEDDLM